MKLEQMFSNVLDLSFDDLVIKVTEDSVVRNAALEAATSNFDLAGTKQKASSTKPKMSEQDKAIIKSLGLNLKDIQTLIKQAR